MSEARMLLTGNSRKRKLTCAPSPPLIIKPPTHTNYCHSQYMVPIRVWGISKCSVLLGSESVVMERETLFELLGFEVLGACEPKTKPYDPMAGRVPHAISG